MAFVDAPITITYKLSEKAKKVHKKTFYGTHIDSIIDKLEKNRLPGFTARTVIMHIGIGKRFIDGN